MPDETDALVEIAVATAFFKPIEIDALRLVLSDYHAGTAGPGQTAVTFEMDGRPLAFAYYAPNVMTDRGWHLYWIFVDRSAQTRGIGAKLLQHVEDDIRAAGGRMLVVETSSLAHYEPTWHFYRKVGYRQVAVVPDLYADGDDMIVFLKRLSEPAPAMTG
jgi:ribosomal protein S18 acetylase RimI-like enzyme